MDAVRPGYRWYRHCVVLANVLQDVADGKRKRVMVFQPPRHGKSELVSRLFTGYFLKRYPHRWVGLNSYGAELAYTLSRNARDFYVRDGGPLASSAGAVKHWETGLGGGLWAAGVGGPITGKGFHLGIIDDPIKNAEEAASEVVRAKHKDWYGSTFYTREEPWSDTDPHGAIVLVQTRWHEADLAGWLLEEEAGEEDNPEHWHVVTMAAIKEADPPKLPATVTLEPDWRAEGEALCPDRRPIDKLRKIEHRIGSYHFAALFQQRPAPAEGGLFKSFPVVQAVPPNCVRVRYWDKAGTKGGGDWTAGVLMAMAPDGRFFVENVVRGQWSAAEREKVIKDTAAIDWYNVHIWVEQEPGSGGKESAENTVIMLAGYVVQKETVTGDKVSRARPLAAQAEVGNVYLLEGEWNRAFVDELAVFPNGRHDDQCLAAGTMIATDRGDVPIEDVRPGMRVLTRKGYRRVLDAGMTSPASSVTRIDLADGKHLIATPNHPVFVHAVGFRRVDECSGAIKMLVCEHNIRAGFTAEPPRSRPSSTRASSSPATRTRPSATTGFTSSPRTGTRRAASTTCTGRCGGTPTGRYPKGTSSTTSTGTRSTTTCPTSLASRTPSTSGSTPTRARGTPPRCDPTSPGFDLWRPSGTARRKGGHGTAATRRRRGRHGFRSRRRASGAGWFTRRFISAPSGFARWLARNSPGPRGRRTGRWRSVRNAGLTSRSRSVLAPRLVVRVRAGYGVATVYNLRVEGVPEYFANGILVHNCDAAAGAFNKLVLAPRPATGTAVAAVANPPVPLANSPFPDALPWTPRDPFGY